MTDGKPGKSAMAIVRRVLVGWGVGLSVLALAIAAGIWYLTDRPVTAPDWVRDRIETRLTENLPNLSVSFGDMVLTVHHGWRPKVQLRNVVFTGATGQEVLALSELQASLAMRPLLRQQVQPKTVDLVGIFATLRRDETGQVTLRASGSSSAAERQAATFGGLVQQLDSLFQLPELAALKELSVDAITLRVEDARSQRAWTIDGARMRLNREADELRVAADLALLGGGAGVATLEANYASRIGETAANFGLNVVDLDARDLATLGPAFGWLDALVAPISGAVRGGVDTEGALTPVNATLQISSGALQPNAQTRPIPFSSARTYFTYDPSREQLEFNEIFIASDWGSLRADGRAELAGITNGRLDELVGQFQLSELVVDPADMFPAPVSFAGADVDFRLIPEPFSFDLGQLRVRDGAQSIRLDGSLVAAPEGWELAVNGKTDDVARARLLELWPAELATPTRDWLNENLLEADLSGVDFALRAVPKRKPDVFLSFDFDQASLRYVKGMSPVTKARGVGTILRNRFVLAVEEGSVRPAQGGEIDVAGSSFIIPDITVRGGAPAVVRLRTDATITATLSLLNEEPLRILDKSDLPVTLADGRAQLTTTLALPLKKGLQTEDVRYDVAGELSSVSSGQLVQDRRLQASVLNLSATNERIAISGDGTFDGLAFSGGWEQPIGPGASGNSTVRAAVDLSQTASDTLQIGLPPRSMRGAARGDLTLNLVKGQAPTFALSSNLRGLRISIPALGWAKSESSTGALEVSGSLGAVPRVDSLRIAAPGLSATGKVSVRAGGGLDQANFSTAKVGGWFDGPVDLIGQGKNAPVAVRVRGGSMDLRKAEFGTGGGGSGGSSGPITLALNRLQITDSIALTDMQGEFRVARGLQGRFTGKVNGRTEVRGQVEPSGARSAFKIQSNNAGGVFAAAGLLKQARGGTMNLVLQPVGTAGAFNGSLRITDTRVRDAPAIAALFNALSVIGLLEQMSGQGLHFQEIDAAFRLTPEKVTLTQASAVGPSIGLSMDGTYDVNSSVMDMRGVFSPIYLINGVGSVLTRKGEGLIGFNFRLSGPSSKPRVQVNPLSGLTPSIFREIFRRPAPKVEVEPGEVPGSGPQNLTPENVPDREILAPRAGDR